MGLVLVMPTKAGPYSRSYPRIDRNVSDVGGAQYRPAGRTGGAARSGSVDAPVGLAATPTSQTAVSLTWTAVFGATQYSIWRNGAVVGTSAVPSFADSGLTASTLYSYQVSAADSIGNVSAKSTAVTVTTLAPGSAPAAPGAPTGQALPY